MAAMGCEYLSAKARSGHAQAILDAMWKVRPGTVTARYAGRNRWLMLWGVGFQLHAEAAGKHQGPSVLWDMGYTKGHYRVSLNNWHPTIEQMDATPRDDSRWRKLGIALRNDYCPFGPILLIGMGQKSKSILREWDWERRTLKKLSERFPNRAIVYRPKNGGELEGVATDRSETIEQALKGKSLVVCRHSNVGIDAAIAGVPVETEHGAAKWLSGKEYTEQTRRDFLARVAWWQWKPEEAAQAWAFLERMAASET